MSTGSKPVMMMGVFSSAHCVPMAGKVEAANKILWANICVASSVIKGKNYKNVFRGQVHSDQFGETSCNFLNEMSKAKFGIDSKNLKVAIIYEDGPYGAGIAQSNDETKRRACCSCSRSVISARVC